MPITAEVMANTKAERIRRIADLAGRKSRERAGRFLVEGPQSVREVVSCHPDVVHDLYVEAAGMQPDSPFANATIATIAGRALRSGIYVHKATREVMDRISSDAQGIAAVCDLEAMRAVLADVGQTHEPSADAEFADMESGGAESGDAEQSTRIGKPDEALYSAFWQVRDPGNAGTVIRASDAAGCRAVVFVDECVDVFNPKVIRSTAGSLFHLPVLSMGTDDFLSWMRSRGTEIIAADVYGTDGHRPEDLKAVLAARSTSTETHGSQCVLFGNEARGLPADILERSDRIVSIPIYGKAESLNLATSAAVMLMSLAMTR